MKNNYLFFAFLLISIIVNSCSENTKKIIPKPTASFTYSVNAENPLEIQYIVSVQYANEFFIDFGDGISYKADTTQKTITHTYLKEGNYDVSLTSTQNQLRSDIFKQTIAVKDLSLIPTFTVIVAEDTVSVINTTQNLPSNATIEVLIDGKPISGLSAILADGLHTISIKITTKTNKVFESLSQNIVTKKKEFTSWLCESDSLGSYNHEFGIKVNNTIYCSYHIEIFPTISAYDGQLRMFYMFEPCCAAISFETTNFKKEEGASDIGIIIHRFGLPNDKSLDYEDYSQNRTPNGTLKIIAIKNGLLSAEFKFTIFNKEIYGNFKNVPVENL